MFVQSSENPCPILPMDAKALDAWLAQADEASARWVRLAGFEASAGSHVLVPGPEGRPAMVLLGVEKESGVWALAGLPDALPEGDYALDSDWGRNRRVRAALGWGLACHRFDRYKVQKAPTARLLLEEDIREEVEIFWKASTQVRDLVNTPAIDLGPEELAATLGELAGEFDAEFTVYDGETLAREFPAIHVVGQAATRGPRLAKLQWGNPEHPPLALVGKGVVFDSGGLNIKPGAGMVLMKKDMGGAAHVIGLARLIMALKLPVNLRVYIPAVENAIAGNAYRPSDIIRTRQGTTVEIGNTDAEGRIILSDALTLAAEEGAERIIDFATLTGAARIALGEDLPPIYGRDQTQLRTIQDLSFSEEDPLWHMPLHRPYKRQIVPAQAELSNTGTTPQGGSLTAALFLDHFVPEALDWLHLDIYAWNLGDRPGRPAGGEVQGIRAIWSWLESVYR